MDTAIRTNSGAPLITPWSARGMSNDKYAAMAAVSARKSEVESAAQKAFDTPVMKAADKDKDYIRQRIEGIKQRLKILQKMYSGNPKQMAHALAQVFKELKAALKDYKAAVDKELGASRSATDAALTAGVPAEPAAPQADSDKDETKKDAAPTDADAAQTAEKAADPVQAETPAPPEAQTPDAPQPQAADTGLYTSVARKVQEMAGADGLDFVKEIKGLAQWIEDKLLAPARIQKAAQKPDKFTDNAFEDVEKTLKDLRHDMEDMERDIKQVAPGVGQNLDVAA
ncbi:MAG TPA: hypothetical protein VG839_00445 [Asticcacaulis sp.]|nr:hypothetical protein [Asticcacaulis sp.]